MHKNAHNSFICNGEGKKTNLANLWSTHQIKYSIVRMRNEVQSHKMNKSKKYDVEKRRQTSNNMCHMTPFI